MVAVSQATFWNVFSPKENKTISIKISLKFVPMGLISNIAAFAQMMACRRPGDKPLSVTMMVLWINNDGFMNYLIGLVWYG